MTELTEKEHFNRSHSQLGHLPVCSEITNVHIVEVLSDGLVRVKRIFLPDPSTALFLLYRRSDVVKLQFAVMI